MAWERSSKWNSWSGLHSWREGSAGQPASTGASSTEWEEWPSRASASSTASAHQRSAWQPAREAYWNSFTEWKEWPSSANASSTAPVRQGSGRQPALDAATTATAAAPATGARTSTASASASAAASTTTAPATALKQKHGNHWQSTIAALNLETPGGKQMEADGGQQTMAEGSRWMHQEVTFVTYERKNSALSQEPLILLPRYWCPACSEGFVKWSQCRQHIYSTCKQKVIGVPGSVDEEALQNRCKNKSKLHKALVFQ